MYGQAGHNSNSFSNELKCANCTGNHSGFSKSCCKWIFEKRVQQVKVERNILFIKACKIVSAENQSKSTPGKVQLLQWWALRTCSYALTQFLSRLISHGLRDRWNPPSSLPLYVQQASDQPRQLQRKLDKLRTMVTLIRLERGSLCLLTICLMLPRK